MLLFSHMVLLPQSLLQYLFFLNGKAYLYLDAIYLLQGYSLWIKEKSLAKAMDFSWIMTALNGHLMSGGNFARPTACNGVCSGIISGGLKTP